MKPLVGVGVAAFKEGRVLLGKRKGAHGEGFWSFAGGHLEFGESVRSCAKRELREETGLTACLLKLGPWTEDIIENKHYITFFVFATEILGEAQLLEPQKCEGWHWFPCNRLPSPLFMPVQSLITQYGSLEDL